MLGKLLTPSLPNNFDHKYYFKVKINLPIKHLELMVDYYLLMQIIKRNFLFNKISLS